MGGVISSNLAELMAIARSISRYPVAAREGEEALETAQERFERDPRRRVTERGRA